MKGISIMLVIGAIFVNSAHGQGFLNLNFESAYNLPANPPIPDGLDVAVTNALPGWSAYAGSALSEIAYVSNFFGGSSSLVELEGGSLALSGDFSAALFDGGSISQIGMVPTNAESLQFEASSYVNLEVTLGGQRLLYSALSQGSDYYVYGANIPAAMDGQVETLAFGIQGLGQSVLDNIEFSTMSVPEPGEWAMVGVGSILVVGIRRFSRRPRKLSGLAEDASVGILQSWTVFQLRRCDIFVVKRPSKTRAP